MWRMKSIIFDDVSMREEANSTSEESRFHEGSCRQLLTELFLNFNGCIFIVISATYAV